jgi:hypothetical protein
VLSYVVYQNLFSCIKAFLLLQGHLSATRLLIKIHASKQMQTGCYGDVSGLTQVMDSIDEYY